MVDLKHVSHGCTSSRTARCPGLLSQLESFSCENTTLVTYSAMGREGSEMYVCTIQRYRQHGCGSIHIIRGADLLSHAATLPFATQLLRNHSGQSRASSKRPSHGAIVPGTPQTVMHAEVEF